jgi:hypothetical protein
MMDRSVLEVGSISTGTMRAEDLVPEFLDALESVDAKRAKSYRWANRKTLHFLAEDRVRPYTEQEQEDLTEQVGYCLDELFDILDEYVPDYCSFGSHPGDGADYGVWIDHDAVDMARSDGELLAVESTSEVLEKLGDGERVPRGILVISDHGNMTLYTLTVELEESYEGYRLKTSLDEVWGIV